jgi:hypothetical protein
VIKGLPDVSVYGVMSRTGNIVAKKKAILYKAGVVADGLLGKEIDFHCIDPGWQYTTPSECACPFPCHKFYDLKAWEWLMENIDKLRPPILFWNIGS